MDANALAFFELLNIIINSVRPPYLIVSSNLTPKVMLAQIKKKPNVLSIVVKEGSKYNGIRISNM